jgi:type I restriction enzyme M protein
MRIFLLQYFRIRAIVSLPYDAFRPFTSTKTSIVFATKRSLQEVIALRQSLAQHGCDTPLSASAAQLSAAFHDVSWHEELIFMAEPPTIGYKRRKNLPDLPMPNFLYNEDDAGQVLPLRPGNASTVLEAYSGAQSSHNDPHIGFWTPLENVAAREGVRLDPKHRWLWDLAVPLSDLLEIVDLPKVRKGELEEEKSLVDLEYVEARQALLTAEVPIVDQLGSDKVRFTLCDLAISKLEPYLAKVIISPTDGDLGSTEWIGLKLRRPFPLTLAAYLLMLPHMCEAYRRLQSGKRHARFDPEEFLNLRIQLPAGDRLDALEASVLERREEIVRMRREELEVRSAIDHIIEP